MKKEKLVTIEYPKSLISESYRTLRTNIQFSSFDSKVKTIVVTSSGPREGKSTICANLAVVIAENGYKTILIDCDQRMAKLHKIFNTSNEKGLSDFLIDNIQFSEAVQNTEIPNLDIITSGTKPPNPSELVASEKMKKFIEDLKETYDYIIIDTPPVIIVTDAQLISTYVDGCILVVASSQVEKATAIKAKELLQKVNARILGVVLNKMDVKQKSYSRYYYSGWKKLKK
ncbi:capsular biosynthesis protein [Clostridium carboxidivorans P7]|uniref:non-specific protein-tyrosine kinase n=1 Tax=Clostridium carboxidivorans P7 TaxID=536227 RepID=C6PXX7_9CLOT|nr:CpsD/CapB family tyrosine-protein kinase [Clostridium carboxidivorans]AKN31960.1 capsular biosynthesis protein [Clostridium carboxidivorans P7]EET85915.1 capsular exopolysaccharide family [Clostridium carboxidivorans P7]EFG87906.1 capsular exopolysaccharide family protein [Clostridium carboxidivorans P7]